MTRRLLSLVALLACAVTAASAQMRPHARWQQLESDHFRVVFEVGLDSLAQHAARRAEAAYAGLVTDLSRPPKGKIDIILGDNFDLTNGAATPFPQNRIYLWARPPVDELSLGYYNDWMDLVISHELTHIFHLDRTSRVGIALRNVFGRLPAAWPVFPVIGTPGWTLEGLATHRESVHTGAGRVHGSYHEMIVRTAILENDFDPLDRVNGDTPIWPGGAREYIYGSLFMDYMAERFGEQTHREFLNKLAGSIIPPPWQMNRIARKAYGKSFSELYREWRRDLNKRYAPLADSIRSDGLTTSERVAGGERYVLHARVSPDNRTLAYVEENGRNTSSIVMLDLATGATTRTRRNALAPIAWGSQNVLFTTQPDFTDPYTVYSDIYYQVDGEQERVTHGARYDAIDTDRSGRKLIVVAHAGGLTSLVQRDAQTGAERVMVPPRTDVQWTLPRWSPDGSRIAAQRWQLSGRHDIVVLDTLGNVQLVVGEDRVVNAAPAWSADGRYVIFASDRTRRINNLYAVDVTAADNRLLQITNLLGGAFYPETSPDGEWIYYSAYHANGFTIERIRFDPQSWRVMQRPASLEYQAVNVPPQSGPALPVSRYSPVRSALPTWWAPYILHDSIQGTFWGATTFGFDDVSRHEYFIALAHNVDNGRSAGFLDYTYAGLGNPVLSLNASREYDILGGESVRREDNISLRATMRRPRWRSSVAFTLGAEGVIVRRDTTARVRDAEDRLVGVIAGVAFGNARIPAYAISPEDGIRFSMSARRRFDIDPVFRDATYTELHGTTAAYKSLDLFGFAHHVVAARASATYRTGLGIGPTDVGGVVNFLPVRGFDESDRIGFRAWSASLEYRLPVALIGRGVGMAPFFIDRIGGSAFLDAGNASCTAEQRAIYRFCVGNTDRGDEMLLSAGAEVTGNVAILSFIPTWLRMGVAQPLQGPRDEVRFYLTLGISF